MAIRRREFLPEPGEELLLSQSAQAVLSRFDRFLEASGLDGADVLSEPLCTTPLPVARKGPGGKPLRWHNANPGFLWHPLMWLPEEAALRFEIRDTPGGDPHVETDAEWAVRISLQLRESGLYDSANGGWLDILALHGLDIEDDAVRQRAQNWLDGEADVILDEVDLDDVIGADSAHWALLAAQDLTASLQPVQVQYLASDLFAMLELDDAPEELVATLAGALLQVPSSGDLRTNLDRLAVS